MSNVKFSSKDIQNLMDNFESGKIIKNSSNKLLKKSNISSISSRFSQKRIENEKDI